MNWKNKLEKIKKEGEIQKKREEEKQKKREEQAKQIRLIIERGCNDFVNNLGRKWKFYKNINGKSIVATPRCKNNLHRIFGMRYQLVFFISVSEGLVKVFYSDNSYSPSYDYSQAISFDVFTKEILNNELNKFLERFGRLFV